VTATEAQSAGLDPQFLESLGPALVGAAASKLFAVCVDDILVALPRSPAHSHHLRIDISEKIAPAKLLCKRPVAKATDDGTDILLLTVPPADATSLRKADGRLQGARADGASVGIVDPLSSSTRPWS
jgi:hypothetical protein